MTTKNYTMKVALIIAMMIGSAVRAENPNRMNEQSQFDDWMSAAEKAIRENEQKGAINNNNDKLNPQDTKFGSGMAQGIFQKQTEGVQGPLNNEARNNSNSREDGLLDMQSQASTGAGIAIGLGATMIATGIPMSLDIFNIPRMVAGLELIAKGAIEIAQGASRSESANQYQGQRGMLNDSPSLEKPTGPNIPIADEDLKKLLEKTDMTPEEFKKRLASGEFKTGADILRAIGRDVDPETLKEGQNTALSMMGDMFEKAKAETKTTINDTVTAKKETSEESSSHEEGAQAKYNQNPETQKSESLDVADNNKNSEKMQRKSGEPASQSSKSSSREIASTEKGAAGTNDFASLYSKLFGQGADGDLAAERNRFRQELAEMGISLPVKGVSIFALAHRQYHEFGKYRKALPRKQARVAQR